MSRILTDLPDDDIKWLDDKAAKENRSRASLLREAVSSYRAQDVSTNTDWLEQGFGAWARLGMEFDPHEYERKRRAEWTRPWDDDYEEVRAESPDCFDEYDDRERAHYLRLFAAAAQRKPDAA